MHPNFVSKVFDHLFFVKVLFCAVPFRYHLIKRTSMDIQPYIQRQRSVYYLSMYYDSVVIAFINNDKDFVKCVFPTTFDELKWWCRLSMPKIVYVSQSLKHLFSGELKGLVLQQDRLSILSIWCSKKVIWT